MTGTRTARKPVRFRTRIMALILAAVLLNVAVLSVAVGVFYTEELSGRIKKRNADTVEQTAFALDRFMAQLDGMAAQIAFGNTVQRYLRGSSPSTYASYQARANVVTVLSSYASMFPGIQVLLLQEGKNPVTDSSIYGKQLSYGDLYYDMTGGAWYNELDESTFWKVFAPNSVQDYLTPRYRTPCHTLAYTVWDVYTLEPLGYLRVDVPLSVVSGYFLDEYAELTNLSLIDQKGRTVHAYGAQNAAVWEDGEGLITAQIASQGWTLKARADKDVIAGQLKDVALVISGIAALLILLFVPVAYRFSHYITLPIEQLAASMRLMRAGNVRQSLPTSRRDEIGELITTFNETTDKIDRLITQANNEALMRKDAEIKALQQQINPHFLYNTLDVVIGMATESRNRDVIRALSMLADMFRYNLNDELFVTLEMELMQLKRYMNIIAYRFGNRYACQYDIPGELLQTPMVRFVLQPLVENAIKHAFAGRADRCRIVVSAGRGGEGMILTIRDFGDGISPERLAELEQMLGEDPFLVPVSESGHIGIGNVYSRIKYVYGDEARMRVESALGEGTSVIIELPLKAGANHGSLPGIDH